MIGSRYIMPIQIPFIRCMSTAAHFQAARCEMARSIQNMVWLQNCFLALSQAGSRSPDKRVDVYTSEERKNSCVRLKDIPLSPNACFFADSQIVRTSVLDGVHGNSGLHCLQSTHGDF